MRVGIETLLRMELCVPGIKLLCMSPGERILGVDQE